VTRGIKITLACATLTLFVISAAGALVYRASQQVPEFYVEAVAIEPEAQRDDRDAFVARATALASDLSGEGRWHSLFTADQINAWLALELANNYPGLLPAELRDPRISLTKDAATIGCQYQSGELASVVTIELDAYLHEPNVVAVRLRQARAGTLPVPLGSILDSISYAAQQLDLQLEWRTSHGDPVALIKLPPLHDSNHESLRLESLELRDGELFVAGSVGHPPLDSSPVVPEPLRVPTAKADPAVDEDQPLVGSAEKATLQK